jgi:uncharacterized membrane protein
MYAAYIGAGIALLAIIKIWVFPEVTLGFNTASIPFIGIFILLFIIMYGAASPYFYGGSWYVENIIRVRDMPAVTMFGCYNNFDRVVKVLKTESYVALRKMMVFIPAAAVAVLEIYLTRGVVSISGTFMSMIAIAGCALAVFGVFMLYKAYAVRFIFVSFVFAENPDLPVREIAAQSMKLTAQNRNRLFGVFLCLLPFYISCFLSIIPMIFVIPAAVNSYALLYNEMKKAAAE